ncbi:MAG: hypothetical protein P4L82_14410 [Ancalomicrobiaceae bacterium]|nr:hypothetical protein [Ancalomicrobiaceae bacterium]
MPNNLKSAGQGPKFPPKSAKTGKFREMSTRGEALPRDSAKLPQAAPDPAHEPHVHSHDARTPSDKPVRAAAQPRRPGRLKGKLIVGPEFFEPLTEAEAAELAGQ